MNNDIKFTNLTELYNRVRPALKSKAHELHKKGFSYISEEDIWNYLKDTKWSQAKDLDLGGIVNDIFMLGDREINEYIKDEIRNSRRIICNGQSIFLNN